MIRALLPLHIRCRVTLSSFPQGLGFASLAHSSAAMEPRFSAGADTSQLTGESRVDPGQGADGHREDIPFQNLYQSSGRISLY
jgi:hypothetical protein